MQLVATLVDAAPFGHERAYFMAFFLDGLWQVTAVLAHRGAGSEGNYFLCNVQYSVCLHSWYFVSVFTENSCKDIKNN